MDTRTLRPTDFIISRTENEVVFTFRGTPIIRDLTKSSGAYSSEGFPNNWNTLKEAVTYITEFLENHE